MIKASKAARKKLMVAQHMRFEASAEKLKSVVDRGDHLLGVIHYNDIMKGFTPRTRV